MAAVRVLLVFGSEPSGHAAAASALEAAGRAAGVDILRVQVAADHHPLAGRVAALGYHRMLRAAPGLYGALYSSDWARLLLKSVRAAYLELGGGRKLAAGVRLARADVVVCPQAAVTAVLAEARRRGELEVPVVGVLTDFGVHPFWAEPPADLLLTPAPETAETLVRAGVPRERVRVTGLPINPAFSERPSREAARIALGLPPKAPVALLSGGSHGLAALDRAAFALLRANPRAMALALCGANDRLRRSLSEDPEAGARLRVFGPQPARMVATLLAAADLHVGKPGGLSSAETLAAGVPMVLCDSLPGQEQANARHLRAIGAAIRGGSSESAGRRAARLLEDRPRLERMRAAARRAGRPDAAAAAIRAALELIRRA